MKNKFLLLLFSLLLVFGIVFTLRFAIGGNEDTWICENGIWIKHGQPDFAPPETGCGNQKLIGGDKDEHGCLTAAGYSWCENKNKCLREWEEPCTQEKAFQILSDLKKETKIIFSGIGNTNFKWNFEEEQKLIEKELNGKVFVAENVDIENTNKIESYFKEKGFTTNRFNVASGTFVSSKGYEKENLFCLITITTTGYDPSNPDFLPDNSETNTIKVECGEITLGE